MFKRFIIFCSGVDKRVLEKCPTETTKAVSVGLSVFLTALLACVSGGYALYFVFGNPFYSVLFGVLWGSLIFNLDRYIVATAFTGTKLLNKIFSVLPRILISLVLAITISKPLELKLFEVSVKETIQQEQQARKNTEEDRFNRNKQDLIRLIDQDKKAIGHSEDAILKELVVREKSVTVAHAVLLYKAKRDTVNTFAAQLQKSRVLLSKIASEISTRRQELVAQTRTYEQYNAERISGLQKQLREMDSTKKIIFPEQPDLLMRLRALSVLKESSDTVNLADNFITMLFILIEVSPVLVKAMSNNKIYEQALAEFVQQDAVVNSSVVESDLELAKKKQAYRAAIELKTNQTSVDYLEKKKVYLEKVRADKWYDKELQKINNSNV